MNTDTTSVADLYHRVQGSGPGVSFIPGASGDSGTFERVAGRLADEFTVVTYDRRGNSRSPRLPAGQAMSIAAQADDVAALLEAVGITPAVVFGTSGGGNILLELVARHPRVVRAAIVHEPALIAIGAPDEDGMGADLAAIFELAASDLRAAMEAFVRRFTSDETFEALEREIRERIRGNGANFFANELESFATYVPDIGTIGATGVPVRILASRDSGDHQTCLWLADQLGSSIEYLSGHHAPYAQHPEVFAEELRPVLRDLWH
jgi:pimeloyl-ACP methyl ester carboxylesterase